MVLVIVIIVIAGVRGSKSPTTAVGSGSPSTTKRSTTRTTGRSKPVDTSGAPTPTVLGPRYAEIDGAGNAVRRVRVPAGHPVILYAVHLGSSTFTIEAKTASGASLGDPVDAFGPYRGTTIVDGVAGQSTAVLDIVSDGTWHIELYPLAMGDGWDGRSEVDGTGDEVLVMPAGLPTAVPVTITNVGASNFVVTAYTDSPHLLVNQLGVVTGAAATIPAGTKVLSVVSDGQWTMVPAH
jgi:hypothetical protein